ncbi:TatD family hydrolase [bacterium]|nr:TatD family hydrolase [bacterium]
MKMVDLDKLLIETDAPYLPVKQFRGQINTPAMITYLYDFISEFL